MLVTMDVHMVVLEDAKLTVKVAAITAVWEPVKLVVADAKVVAKAHVKVIVEVIVLFLASFSYEQH